MKKWLIALMALASAATCSAADIAPSAHDDTVTLYFARHGKTLFNTFDRVQGWADTPLTEDGVRVARYLGEGLKGIAFDRYYSSDAGRQRETMAVILKQMGVANYQLNELPGLREAFFGGFEGGFNKDMAEAGAHALGLADSAALFQAMKAGTLPVKDSQDALATIVKQAQANGDKTVLAISSGTSMQIMISDLTDSPDKNKPLANAAVVKIIYKNGHYSVPEIGTLHYVEAGKQRLNNQK